MEKLSRSDLHELLVAALKGEPLMDDDRERALAQLTAEPPETTVAWVERSQVYAQVRIRLDNARPVRKTPHAVEDFTPDTMEVTYWWGALNDGSVERWLVSTIELRGHDDDSTPYARLLGPQEFGCPDDIRRLARQHAPTLALVEQESLSNLRTVAQNVVYGQATTAQLMEALARCA